MVVVVSTFGGRGAALGLRPVQLDRVGQIDLVRGRRHRAAVVDLHKPAGRDERRSLRGAISGDQSPGPTQPVGCGEF